MTHTRGEQAPGEKAPGEQRRGARTGDPGAPRWRLLKRMLLIWIPATLIVALLVFAVTPLGRYLIRAGIAEAEILLAREPIERVVADPATPEATRAKLQLVLEARRFAIDSLQLSAGESFTTFAQLDRDTLVLVLSAAPKDRLVIHSWWYPVVGRLPYRGFFNFDQGRAEASRMAAEGYDVNLRPASAFSTLGWFNDPLLSTTLAADSVNLVDTVIHELTHSTFFAPGQGVFNESFANFVGARGAARFFRARGDTASAVDAELRWEDQKVLAGFWTQLYELLDSAFRANPDDRDRRLELRDSIYADARRQMVDSLAPLLQRVSRGYLERVRLDNASLLARRVYMTDLQVFDDIYAREGHDLQPSFDRIVELARSRPSDPLGALREWLDPAAG